jgi:hypothetical protein
MTMSRWALLGLTAVAAFLAANLPALFHGAILNQHPVRIAGALLGGFTLLFALSWLVAGIVYLATWGKASRTVMAITSVLVSIVVGLLTFRGLRM